MTAVVVAAMLLTCLPDLGTAEPTRATRPSYVALGDSYASGVGTRDYRDDGTRCRRSPRAYAGLIAARRRWVLDFQACSGATIPTLTRDQLGALSADTDYVTVSIGGNDAGFAPVLIECGQPAARSECDGAIDDAQAFIRGTLPRKLRTVYAAIARRAPRARVVVVGYPLLFQGEDCSPDTYFSPHEQRRLNTTNDLLDGRIAIAARRAGFRFADPRRLFAGHAVCDDVPWINGLSRPRTEGFHPNRLGHRLGYAPVVGARLG